MKQEITKAQLDELSEKEIVLYDNWLLSKGYINNEITIGQMIQFLDEEQEYQFYIFRRTIDWKVVVNDNQYGKVIPGELCDFLWEAVRDVLKRAEEH